MRDRDTLSRDREALAHLHARLTDMSRDEYNALIHAIWNIDSQLNTSTEGE